MYAQVTRRDNALAAFVVAAVTVLALTVPAGAPLHAAVYPGPDAGTIDEALIDANLETGFDSAAVTQFETATFRATIIYGTSTDPGLPTVKIAWSNEAALAAQDEETFDIEQTSTSRRFLDAGSRRPDGAYELTWTWDVTPLLAGEQTLILSILPTVVIEGVPIPDLANINEPIPVTVDVHPVKHAFDEVLAAAASMDTDVPGEMIVGDEYAVSASMSLAGHADTVSADIELARSEDSAAVTIVEESAAARAVAHAAAGDDSVVRRWTVTPDEPGQVGLVFTAKIQGQAAEHGLQQDIPVRVSARAAEPGPSFWDRLQQPVQYLAPFVALAIGILALWAAWKKRKADAKKQTADEEDPEEQRAAASSGDAAP